MTAKRTVRIARTLRASDTSTEEMLWNALRDRRLDGWKFRRQFPVAGFVADFGCVAARLTIEVDGRHHAEQIEADRARESAIAAAGYLEIRFTNEDVQSRLAWVIQEIRRALDAASGPANAGAVSASGPAIINPFPWGEGGLEGAG